MEDKKPALEAGLVRDFVANSHGNLERVQELLLQEPSLINASWDWGGGDWETGLGAAAHMGRKDIAQFLLARGARMIFLPLQCWDILRLSRQFSPQFLRLAMGGDLMELPFWLMLKRVKLRPLLRF